MVCRCVNERARIPVGADSISAREVCGGARCAGAYRMRPYGQAETESGNHENTKTKRMLAVAALLAVGLALMLYYAAHKQGYHVDELYHL